MIYNNPLLWQRKQIDPVFANNSTGGSVPRREETPTSVLSATPATPKQTAPTVRMACHSASAFNPNKGVTR